jgi:uncharacterized protein YutE (UPF0331/DUF86 family)
LADASDVLQERLKLLNEYTADLRELQAVDLQTYEENKIIRRAVERTLHLAVEACLDIGQHLIAQKGFRMPVDNKDVFQALYEEAVISEALLPTLIMMAKFRNLIVHDYVRIDNAIVFEVLKRRLSDFERFVQEILGYLDV